MTQILEVKVVDDDVWLKVKLQRNTDVLGTFKLYTPYEIKMIERDAVEEFLNWQRDWQYSRYVKSLERKSE